MDASERLMQLSLTEVQQREIVRVLVHCCGNVSFFTLPLISLMENISRNGPSILTMCLLANSSTGLRTDTRSLPNSVFGIS